MNNKNISNRVISASIAVLVIIIILAVNILSGVICTKLNAKIDLTKGQVLSFSQSTKVRKSLGFSHVDLPC